LGQSKFDREFVMCAAAVLSWKAIIHSECWRQKYYDFLVALNASETIDRLETVAFNPLAYYFL